MNRRSAGQEGKPASSRRADPRPKSKGKLAANTTRAEILDAAARLIVDLGYDACTMRKVADQVQIQAGSLYYHFASKDEIVEEIMNSGIELLLDEVQRRLAELPQDTAFEQRLRAAMNAHISCLLSENSAFMHVYEYVPPVLKRRSRAMRDKYATLWIRLFEQGRASGEIDAQVNLPLLIAYLLGGINRIPEWFRRTKFTLSDVLDMATNTLLHGVLRPPASGSERKAGRLVHANAR